MPLELRILARYAVPLVVLALIALAPVLVLELRMRPPADYAAAKTQLRALWLLIPLVWFGQLVLVGAAAPLVRAVHAGAPLSQLRALRVASGMLVRALVPCTLAIVAILVGGAALVVPGILITVLFALTGASRAIAEPLPAAMLDSARIVRARPLHIAALVLGALAADLAITYLAQRFLFPLPKKPTPAQLAAFVPFARVAALGIVVISPAIAVALAAAYERGTLSTSTTA